MGSQMKKWGPKKLNQTLLYSVSTTSLFEKINFLAFSFIKNSLRLCVIVYTSPMMAITAYDAISVVARLATLRSTLIISPCFW